MTAKTLGTMQDNVGNMLHDATTSMKALIKVWINDAYRDAWRREIWSDLVDDDYTFESVVDQAEYSYPSDFGKELIVADITNGHLLKRHTIKEWWDKRARQYDDEAITSGNPQRYAILPESGKIKLDPAPDAVETYAMPYMKDITDLSSTSDRPAITTISTYLEFYAMSMGFSYKKEFDVSALWHNKAESELQKAVREEKVKLNQVYQRILSGYMVSRRFNLLGDKSYDTV
jgi:hypothetical protein